MNHQPEDIDPDGMIRPHASRDDLEEFRSALGAVVAADDVLAEILGEAPRVDVTALANSSATDSTPCPG